MGCKPHRPIREEVKLRLDCRKHRHRTRFSSARLWDQAARAISTGQLKALLPFHTRPINVVVCHDPSGRLTSGRSHLQARFPLRCSAPDPGKTKKALRIGKCSTGGICVNNTLSAFFLSRAAARRLTRAARNQADTMRPVFHCHLANPCGSTSGSSSHRRAYLSQL